MMIIAPIGGMIVAAACGVLAYVAEDAVWMSVFAGIFVMAGLMLGGAIWCARRPIAR